MGPRVRYLDGLRAVAVLGVVAHHVVKYGHPAVGNLLERILLQGHHGVELFFVISGFCLSLPVLSRLQGSGSARFDVAAFGAKRLVRILPPFYAAIAVYVLLGSGHVSLHDVMLQSLFIDKGTQLLNPSFWTLPVEFRWYLMFPLLLVLWVRNARGFLCLLVAAFVLAQTRALSTDIAALPAFMLGIVAADIHLRKWKAWYAFPLFAMTLVVAFLQTSATDAGQDTSALWEASMFLFVVAAGCVPLLNAALSTTPLVWIGVASYSIYLFHDLALRYAEQWHWSDWACAAAGVSGGLIMWLVAERPFTQVRVRGALTAPLKNVLQRCFALAGVPESVTLDGVGARRHSLASQIPAIRPLAQNELV